MQGSSPLTRGKRWPRGWPAWPTRLIPAHAGKTLSRANLSSGTKAHPRSRGENVSMRIPTPPTSGSSPLTRGKPRVTLENHACKGLIPAHAGKTMQLKTVAARLRAHPRSRGENVAEQKMQRTLGGSSPLTRGKPSIRERSRAATGLIPAHAGKTRETGHYRPAPAAHPRSRGENSGAASKACVAGGSSPLTRGKPGRVSAGWTPSGLIPAHAGKTRVQWRGQSSRTAHPRSRGENRTSRLTGSGGMGSSPLTRGKRPARALQPGGPRLIPAHAGKTRPGSPRMDCQGAHPRSRGENPQARSREA